MNYYEARELKKADGTPAGLWHWTCQNDGRIWPVGYCAEGCAGHATAEEAQEHWRQYCLDTAMYHEHALKDSRRKCAECGEWCGSLARYGVGNMGIVVLCAAHLNRETLEKHVSTPERIMSSW